MDTQKKSIGCLLNLPTTTVPVSFHTSALLLPVYERLVKIYWYFK